MKKFKDYDLEKLIAHGFEIMRFGIVGVGATLTHLAVAYVLSTYASVPLILANIAAFLVAFVISFLGHYHWTFKSAGPKRESLVKFFIVGLTGLAGSTILLSLLIHFDIANNFIKLVISIFIIPVITYILSKSWAFRKAKGNVS